MLNNLDEWFAQEVLPLEGILMRYLRQNWRNGSELVDLRQEVYVRVYESARSGIPERTAPFLLATARNLLIDRARKSQVVSIEAYAELDDLSVCELTPERHASGRAELNVLLEALDTLPPRCREVVVLRKVEGLSQRDVAAEMARARLQHRDGRSAPVDVALPPAVNP